ncbi:hypothetical protein NHQ30_007238 [Ciborinia camelliae]|nr:hypothetical protein NHQ30_007238 [Ciborinia camelliae]
MTTSVVTKWGSIVIFKGENWAEFRDSALLALAAAGAIGIVENTEDEPNPREIDDHEDWKKRRGFALSILSSGVDSIYRSSLLPFAREYDAAGMWDHLREHDVAVHPQYIAEVRKQFHFATFDPKTQTLRQFLEQLLHFQRQTSSSARSISDEEVYQQLLIKIPDLPDWIVFCLICLTR